MKISFIIPTVSRPAELKRLLESFTRQTRPVDEIIIVEQGSGESEAVAGEFTSLPVKYFKVGWQSLPRARNFGVANSSGDVVSFLDDDIVLPADYVGHIESFFSAHPDALGMQGVIANFEQGHAAKVGGRKFVYCLYNLFAKIFLLNNSSRVNKLLWSGRNQYASRAPKTANCQWLSGIGNYRRAVFTEFKFDENLTGYALGEDKLFSYPIFIKYPTSLYVDPALVCEHRPAEEGRPIGREQVVMKIRYTRYLWQKLFAPRGILALAAYWWANLGDLIVVLFSVAGGQNPIKFFWWHLQEYWKILWHPRLQI